jgi:Ca2+-transporting ATPase
VVFVAEREEPYIMNRPPRRPEDRLLGRRTITLALVQGLLVLGFVLGVYFSAVSRGLSLDETRTLTFVTIVMANLALIAVNRSWSQGILTTLGAPNRAFWAVTGGTLFFLAVAVALPAAREVFRFAVFQPGDLVLCILAGILSVLWFELYKTIRPSAGP